jgi:hypothetical protein
MVGYSSCCIYVFVFNVVYFTCSVVSETLLESISLVHATFCFIKRSSPILELLNQSYNLISDVCSYNRDVIYMVAKADSIEHTLILQVFQTASQIF